MEKVKMKGFLFTLLTGAAAGAIGIILSYLSDSRLLIWIATGMLIALAIALYTTDKRHRLLWVLLGGAVICVGYFIGHLVRFPMVAWYLFGAVFMALCAPNRVIPKIVSSVVGFFAGFLGMGIMPLITMVCLPLMGFSSSFSYDIEELGFIMTGIFFAVTAFFIKKWK